MSVVTGALGSLGPKLLQLLHEEYKLQKGVQKQVQWLHEELESVKAFLDKVAGVPWDRLDEQVKVWARQVREASYDMEDALDTFLVHFDGGAPADPSRLKRAVNKMGKVFLKAKARRNIARTIEAVRKHLEEIAKRHKDYKDVEIMSNKVATTSTIDPRLRAMYKEAGQLIGVDKSSDELISMLMPSQSDDNASDKKITKKVSIVGIGGLGKTTLAKVVYDKVKSQYDCGAFVSVGRDLDFVKVFKDILYDLDKEKYKNIHDRRMGADLLIREVREFLENKRYFVVVDDVWEVKTWENIKLSLVENNYGSRVITTTRNLDVAKKAGTVYKLKPLSYDNSKKLFYTRMFGVDKKCDDKQQDGVSDKILKKCDGVPLAIITMTSLLVGKPEDEWCEVYNSIGFGLNKDNMDTEDTVLILSFSYYDLPSHLRTCLLYLCTYPEDSLIEKDSLIWKWIAEGLVHVKQGTNGLFGLGERYFNDLINRSMIQAVENKSDGIIIGCRVHDMVLDMVRNFSFEENFVALSHDNIEGTSSSSIVRRLAHQNRIFEYINSTDVVAKLQNMRSYTAFRCCINNWDQFSRFKLLRVLDIVGCIFKEEVPHLESIGNLLHLRYLGLKCFLIQIPKQIGNLKLLQTLDVGVSDGRDLQASVLMLKQLVRLCVGRNVPDGIGKLISLEELIIQNISFRPERSFVKELGSLQQLRVLQFSTGKMDESMQRDFVESLRNLQRIQHIKVMLCGFEEGIAMWEAPGIVLPRSLQFLDLGIRFSKLPSCINPSLLPNLFYLKLSVITMHEQDLKILSRMPVLCFLGLEILRSTAAESSINVDNGCFPKLRYFKTNATVQFRQHTGDDSSISFCICYGDDAKLFGSRKSNCRKVVPSAVMQNLEVIEFNIFLPLKDDSGDCDCRTLGLEYLPSLLEVRGTIFWGAVSAPEVDAEFVALRKACKFHQNHPTLNMRKFHPKWRYGDADVDVGKPSVDAKYDTLRQAHSKPKHVASIGNPSA